MSTIKIGNGNTTVNEGVLTGSTLDIGNGNNTVTLLDGSTLDTITVGNGNNTLDAHNLSHSTINIGNGNDTVTANGNGNTIIGGNGANTITAKGDGDSIAVGDGKNRITAGNHAGITIGSGNNVIVAGSDSTIGPGAHKDNGNNTVTAGPDSTINLGDGQNLVFAGSDSTIAVGNGNATIHAGTSDTITIGKGADRIIYDGLTPSFTSPASLTVDEEGHISFPISLGAASLGHEVVFGFRSNQDVITLDTSDFADFDTVKKDAKQVGADTVITLDPADTITLKGVALSSLSASNFQFISGTGSDIITITGIPSDEKLSAGTKNSDGSWTLTTAQLSGLTLDAGEPIGWPTPVDLKVSIANPAGQGAVSTQDVALKVNALPPTVSVKMLAAQPGDPATETRLLITAATDDADGGDDYINRIELSSLLSGKTLSDLGVTLSDSKGLLSGTTITTTGHPGTFSDEVDVFTPAATTTKFDLGITGFSDEPHSPEQSAATSYGVEVDYKSSSYSPVFNATKQSIWNSGNAFTLNYDKFFGIDVSKSGGTSLAVLTATGSVHLKAGLSVGLTFNGGSFDATLPFNVNLGNTYNPNNQTLEVDPTSTQGPGGTISTTGPSGSLLLDLIFDAFAKAFVSVAGTTIINIGHDASHPPISINIDQNLVDFTSGEISLSIGLPPPLDAVSLTFAWPTLNASGTGPNTTGAHTIEANGTSNNFFQISLDVLALALALAGVEEDPFNIHDPDGVFNINLLSPTIGAGLAFTQTFDLNGTLPSATLTDGATTQTLTFGTPTTLYNVSNTYSLNLTPSATLENNTALTPDITFGISALSFSIKDVGAFGPLISFTTAVPLANISVFDKTFPVTFAAQTLANIKVT